MADYILTYSKIQFTPLDPKEDDICIEDIAHALSLMTRANGHFSEFFSVAQHCILCCEEAMARGYSKKVALACLLHDASEAYLADITRPVKKNLSTYREIEARLQNAIFNKYIEGILTDEEKAQVSAVDDALLYYEFKHYMDVNLESVAPRVESNLVFETKPFVTIENKFLRLFRKLANDVQ